MDSSLEELKKLHKFYENGRYSMQGIASALGVDRRTITRWFQSKNQPTEKYQEKIRELVEDLKKSARDETLL